MMQQRSLSTNIPLVEHSKPSPMNLSLLIIINLQHHHHLLEQQVKNDENSAKIKDMHHQMLIFHL
jgi:hypothetical protein